LKVGHVSFCLNLMVKLLDKTTLNNVLKQQI
jgi:hypothetical protein